MTVRTTYRDPKIPSAEKPKRALSRRKEAILQDLVYEIIDGKPVYYRGYERVLSGELPKEAIMGSSLLQSTFITYLLIELGKVLTLSEYLMGTNELGVLYERGSWVSTDIAVIRKESVKDYPLDNHYFSRPPALVIEVDTKASFENFDYSEENYYHTKTKRYLDFGVEKVVWIYTKSKMVMVAEHGKDWITGDWERKLVLIDGKEVDLGEIIRNLNIK